jgi:hypothetical protein
MTRGSEYALRRIPLANGKSLLATPVFDTYWRFAYLRQEVFMRRVLGGPFPWTDDPILSRYRFTNPYRASDRVSQYLIKSVIYSGPQDARNVFFRVLLFKLFNRVDTWERLERRLGTLTADDFDVRRFAAVLDDAMRCGTRLYSAAYIMPCPAFGAPRKHVNHLKLIDHMLNDQAPSRIANAPSLADVFEILLSYPSIGRFLAFQFAIDLNYSEITMFEEKDHVVAGPGARDGISKCFADTAGLSDEDVIRVVADMADAEFARLQLNFRRLWGRPLQLIDCQNLFCEVDKYARVAHPDVPGRQHRLRIKQRFAPSSAPLPQYYPRKWRLAPTATVVNSCGGPDPIALPAEPASFSDVP